MEPEGCFPPYFGPRATHIAKIRLPDCQALFALHGACATSLPESHAKCRRALRAFGQTTYQRPPLEVPAIPTAQSNLPNTLPGVVIESWHFDAQHKTLTLRLVNHSHSDVTAFNISIAVKYADGSTNPSYADGIPSNLQDHQIMEDMLNLMNQPDHKAFAAGTAHDHVMYGEEKDIADIQAVVDVVAYADGSADVLDNDRAFRNLVAERADYWLWKKSTRSPSEY